MEAISTMTYSFIIRMVVATICGLAIGAEREYRAKEAGLRTHFLVSLGSAMFMILSGYALLETGMHFDPARIAAQVVTGIGFIGAGTIMIQKQSVKGLTTAAGLWATAGIGMAIGAGMYIVGIVATMLVLFGFEFLSKIVKGVGSVNRTIEILTGDKDIITKILGNDYLTKHRFISYKLETYEKAENENEKYKITLCIVIQNSKQDEQLHRLLHNNLDIRIISIE